MWDNIKGMHPVVLRCTWYLLIKEQSCLLTALKVVGPICSDFFIGGIPLPLQAPAGTLHDDVYAELGESTKLLWLLFSHDPRSLVSSVSTPGTLVGSSVSFLGSFSGILTTCSSSPQSQVYFSRTQRLFYKGETSTRSHISLLEQFLFKITQNSVSLPLYSYLTAS